MIQRIFFVEIYCISFFFFIKGSYFSCHIFSVFKACVWKKKISDVLCIDETRVVLKIGPAGNGDYIHANYVLFSECQNKFICTQVFLDFFFSIFRKTIFLLCWGGIANKSYLLTNSSSYALFIVIWNDNSSGSFTVNQRWFLEDGISGTCWNNSDALQVYICYL